MIIHDTRVWVKLMAVVRRNSWIIIPVTFILSIRLVYTSTYTAINLHGLFVTMYSRVHDTYTPRTCPFPLIKSLKKILLLIIIKYSCKYVLKIYIASSSAWYTALLITYFYTIGHFKVGLQKLKFRLDFEISRIIALRVSQLPSIR